jgi:chloramphenicol O-acetyltransferase type B
MKSSTAMFSPFQTLISFVRTTRRLRVALKAFGRVRAGRSLVVGPAFRLARGRTLTIGDRVSIGRAFECMTDAVIGDDVMISANVAFIGNDHAFDSRAETIQTQGPLPPSKIVLAGDNLLGYGTVVLGNVTIGRGAIVGAGSLVTRDLPPGMVCVGRPARPVRSRYALAESGERCPV